MKYICIYSKAPIAGKTKSRLASKIGPETAAELTRAMLEDLCNLALKIKNVSPQIWFAPENSPEDFESIVPPVFTFHRQSGRDLGERMSGTFAKLLKAGSQNQAIIIGSDCITHTCLSVMAAFKALESCSVVIQPAIDGGYVLVGQSCWVPELFVDVDWGSRVVYQQSISKLTRSKIKYKKLSMTFDIDRVEDLRRMKSFIEKKDCPSTFNWLKKNGFN